MAKKRKRKRKVVQAPVPPPSAGARQERKEQARRERERIIRASRRRRILARAVRWGVVAAVIAGITGFVGYRFYQDRRVIERADAAAQSLGCGEIQDVPGEGRGHIQPGSSPPTYGTRPATSGPHSGSALPPNVRVYDEEVPEALAVHNLEHAYVFVYYRAEGQGALPQNIRDELADLARGEQKVILAPYSQLPEGTSLSFVAWTKLQECSGVTDGDAAVLAAQGFIKRFRGTTNAPEPSAQ